MPDANNSGDTKIIYFNNLPVGKIPTTGDMRKDLEAAEAFLKEGGYLPEKLDDIDAMHNQANSFAKTAYDLYQRDLRSIPRVSASFIPFVVNAALNRPGF